MTEELDLMSFRPEPQERFLAKYLKAARHFGVISNAGLFKEFPQERLFEAFKDEPKNRASLLAANSKMPFEIAEHLDVAGCLQVFNIALDKLGEATPDKVFDVVTADELERLFEDTELCAFVEETKWDERDTPEHRQLIATLLREFKAEKLGGSTAECLRAIEDAVGIESIVRHLPIEETVRVVAHARAIAEGRDPKAFGVEQMAEVVDTDLLAKYLPLPVLMRPIRAAFERFGFVKKQESAEEKAEEPAPAGAAAKDEEAIREIVDPKTDPPPPPSGATPPPLPPKGTSDGEEVSDAEVVVVDDDLSPEERVQLAALEDGEKKADELLLDAEEDEDDRTQVRSAPLVPSPGAVQPGKPPPLRKSSQKR